MYPTRHLTSGTARDEALLEARGQDVLRGGEHGGDGRLQERLQRLLEERQLQEQLRRAQTSDQVWKHVI